MVVMRLLRDWVFRMSAWVDYWALGADLRGKAGNCAETDDHQRKSREYD